MRVYDSCVVGPIGTILSVVSFEHFISIVVWVAGSVAEDLGYAGMRKIYVVVLPYLVLMGTYMLIVGHGDGEMMSIHACNPLIGGKAHKR